MLNLPQIGTWTLRALGVALVLIAIQSSLDQQLRIETQEWGVFPHACQIAGELALAGWFLGSALQKKKMPVGLGQAGLGLILAGLLLSAIVAVSGLATQQ